MAKKESRQEYQFLEISLFYITNFMHYSGVFIVELKKVNAGRDVGPLKNSLLTLSSRRSLSYRTNLQSKSMDWWLYNRDSVMKELRLFLSKGVVILYHIDIFDFF